MRNIISEKDETNCCGCGACSKCCPRHAIYMEEDENGFDYPKITQLIVTQDMSERKTKMIELGDAFIAFPGGTGTLEEITEVMSKVSLKHLKTPCMLYNLNGYYDDLKKLLDKMITFDLSSKEKQEGIYFVENLEEIKEILK